MIQLIIFDMAGTSVDENNLVYKTIRKSFIQKGIMVSLDTVLQLGAGKEKRQAIRDILATTEQAIVTDELVESIYKYFNEALMKAYDECEMEIFPSVRKVLVALRQRGIKTAFNTGYSREVAQKILKRVDIIVGKDIDALATASDVAAGRPAPDMIQHLCDQLNISPRHTVKIGDSGVDIEEGKNANVQLAIGVTTGAQTREMLLDAKPDFILDDMMELLPLLDKQLAVI